MFPEPYKVYIQTDDAGRVTAIQSSAFLIDTDGWALLDSGYGDRYHHAQGNYLRGPLMDERGIWRYKLVDGQPVERTAEEMDADYSARPAPPPTTEERMNNVEQRTDALESASDDIILMMADLIGG